MKKVLFFLFTLALGVLIGYIGFHLYENQQLAKVNRNKYNLTRRDSLKSKACYGDINAYEQLHGLYRDNTPGDFLFWAMYMANKYHYTTAYEDVYYCIANEYPSDSAIFKMDNETRQFALGYLKVAAQKGDTSAMQTLTELRTRNIPEEWLK